MARAMPGPENTRGRGDDPDTLGAKAWGLDSGEGGSSYVPIEPDGRAYYDEVGSLKFYPPLYRQRYETVKGILNDKRWSPPFSSVVEFGCAELAMFPYFKQLANVTKIIMVDIDADLLEYNACRASPLTFDYLCPRATPLHVEVLCGSVADCDARLQGANAVVCIELIEHLEMDIVEKLGETIFGFIEPEIAIFTTPNSDFNVLLNGLDGKFRHYDHKFEWSRKEFQDWTNKITSCYPQYQVEISGVGVPPQGQESVGHCSQLALFIRSRDYSPRVIKDSAEVYNVCRIYDHPMKQPDHRSEEEKLQDEIRYQLNRLGYFDQYREEAESDFAYVPLEDLVREVRSSIPEADTESIRCQLPPDDIIEKDGIFFVSFNCYAPCDSSDEDNDNAEDAAAETDRNVLSPEADSQSAASDERWDVDDTPPMFPGPRYLADYHMAMASFDNAANLMRERQSDTDMFQEDWTDVDVDDGHDEYDSEESEVAYQLDCEWQWNSLEHSKRLCTSCNSRSHVRAGDAEAGVSQSTQLNEDSVCSTSSPLSSPNQENPNLSSKREPITDSGVDLSPLLNPNCSQDEIGDVFPVSYKLDLGTSLPMKPKELPKSTSVEVLHLDGSCSLKRRAGLEYVEFTPSTSVALCYTGQTYCHSDKIPESSNMSLSSERKSLDGSLVRDGVDSCSLDFAGDSGYPNSSSLHHDVDVDMTPEQVDDISTENDERSNQSLSEDEFSDSSDRRPALPRRMIHPRHPVVPIVFENVENGDLANNNRDGEGNNAVAPLGDEREFVAIVHEGNMQPLLAAPVVDDAVVPNGPEPFPDWFVDLLRIEDGDQVRVPKEAEEVVEHDEGLGDDSI
ncbi:uncharacterized protein LOC117644097 [Thrips palmi]|uniref:Small RNA 2'-O-methyltransferase n=1 Tax=Thrips palmi TaxID=161013 RepID=A0A6P8ZLN9_THRPL|nr:uncharacterized protein LOC117644097 [Thrips palmi]XP_034239185.1 uncharacterized protein LOC117644097 [Thrips palmi]XP_034239186.1 uncharacterized protein LOC117644097 [Thrips palmi]